MGTGAEVFRPRQNFKRLWVTLKVPGSTMTVINARCKVLTQALSPKLHPRPLTHPPHHPKSKSDFCITNVGTEAQRSYAICPKSHSKEGVTVELEPRQSAP